MEAEASASLTIVVAHRPGEEAGGGQRLLVRALRDCGARVHDLPVPSNPLSLAAEHLPSGFDELRTGLSQLADGIASALKGVTEGRAAGRAWLGSALQDIEGKVDGVVCLDASLARLVFSVAETVWPRASRVAVLPHFDFDPAWSEAPFDHMVAPLPDIGRESARVLGGMAHVHKGGPVVAGEAGGIRRLDPERCQVVVSFARLDAGDVDPVLFQLSLARPEHFDLLLLPTGRDHVDSLVASRAANYGMRGKRPRAGADTLAWVRGADVLMGLPSPEELAVAAASAVPQLLFTSGPLAAGEAVVVEQGIAIHASAPVTLSVQLERLLPGGDGRAAVEERLANMGFGGPESAARQVVAAIEAGRPAKPGPPRADRATDDELEDIGGPDGDQDWAAGTRKSALSDVILRQKAVTRRLQDAREDHLRWSRRSQLAERAGKANLMEEARLRVKGSMRLVQRLEAESTDLMQLRERLGGSGSGKPARDAPSSGAATSTPEETPSHEEAFSRLEMDDAVARLKRRMDEVEGGS